MEQHDGDQTKEFPSSRFNFDVALQPGSEPFAEGEIETLSQLRNAGQLFSMGTLNAKISSKLIESNCDQLGSESVNEAGILPTMRWLSTSRARSLGRAPSRPMWIGTPQTTETHGRGPKCGSLVEQLETFVGATNLSNAPARGFPNFSSQLAELSNPRCRHPLH